MECGRCSTKRLRFLNHNYRLWGFEISLNDPYCPGHPRAGTFFATENGVEIVEDGLRLKPKMRVRLVTVAGLRDMMLSERAA